MKIKVKPALLNTFLIIISLAMMFPLFWMLIYSFKTYPESYNSILSLIKAPFTLNNYIDAFSSDSFIRYFFNSTFIALIVTAGNILFCTFVAYALVRKEFKGKSLLFATIAGVMIIPQHVIMIPLYRLMVNFNWINEYYSLIVPWLITPFGIYLLHQYLIKLPSDIEDAARIDGAGNWYILFKIVMPLCKPILIVLGIYTFLGNWNSFLFPFLFSNTESMRTLPVGLTFYMGKQTIDWGHIMAGAGISAIPIIIVFLIFQKQIIKGITAGAIKE